MSRWLVYHSSAAFFPLVLSKLPRLLNYTPGATIVRMLTTNVLIAYLTSWVLYLSGASEDPRMLLPAWISIATVSHVFSIPAFLISLKEVLVQTLTVLYHLSQRKINIKRETSASISVFSITSFISLCCLLLQLHLTRANDPVVPVFVILRKALNFLFYQG